MSRYAEITDQLFNKYTMPLTNDLRATCAKCGYIASDPYNWSLKP